jgi:uncharacterized protein YndB with AHSA1/START domain
MALRPSNDPNAVMRSIRIAARPETVFTFFTDPANLLQWKGIRAQLDPRPGGMFQVALNEQDVVQGEYLEIVPYRRIVFTWGWDAPNSPVPPGASTVEIEFLPDGADTLVQLRHCDLPAPVRQAHEQGWDFYLPRLALAVATHASASGRTS